MSGALKRLRVYGLGGSANHGVCILHHEVGSAIDYQRDMDSSGLLVVVTGACCSGSTRIAFIMEVLLHVCRNPRNSGTEPLKIPRRCNKRLRIDPEFFSQ